MYNSNKKRNRQGFTMIQNDILLSDVFFNLADSSRSVYLVLSHYSDGKGKEVWPSIKTISSIIQKCERTVQRSINELTQNNLIRVVEKPGKPNVFQFYTPDTDVTPLMSPPTSVSSTPDIHVTTPPTPVSLESAAFTIQDNESESLTILSNNTTNNNQKDDRSKKIIKEKETKLSGIDLKRQQFIEYLEKKLHVVLNIGCIEAISKFDLDKMLAYKYEYAHQKRLDKIKNMNGWWNYALFNPDYDLTNGYGSMHDEERSKLALKRTQDLIKRQDKNAKTAVVEHNGMSLSQAFTKQLKEV